MTAAVLTEEGIVELDRERLMIRVMTGRRHCRQFLRRCVGMGSSKQDLLAEDIMIFITSSCVVGWKDDSMTESLLQWLDCGHAVDQFSSSPILHEFW